MMIVLPETTKTATALNVHGDNGVWKKPKSLGNDKDYAEAGRFTFSFLTGKDLSIFN
jgi:hypothetical protein